MSDLALRPATADDVPRITAVVEAAYAHYPDRIGGRPRPMDDDYGAVVETRRVRVAERDGEICGVVVLAIEQGDEFWIDNVAVHPAHQGPGSGAHCSPTRRRSLSVRVLTQSTSSRTNA